MKYIYAAFLTSLINFCAVAGNFPTGHFLGRGTYSDSTNDNQMGTIEVEISPTCLKQCFSFDSTTDCEVFDIKPVQNGFVRLVQTNGEGSATGFCEDDFCQFNRHAEKQGRTHSWTLLQKPGELTYIYSGEDRHGVIHRGIAPLAKCD